MLLKILIKKRVAAAHDDLLSKGIKTVERAPQKDGCHEPIASPMDEIPQFDKTDIERQQHHYDSHDAYQEQNGT